MKIVVFSGAGLSVDSGVPSYRDDNGFWSKYNPDEIATITGWLKDPQKVLDFYNMARPFIKDLKPNDAHHLIAELENKNEVVVITQNVDNFHERAGSTEVLHLHGNLFENTNTSKSWVVNSDDPIKLGDLAPDGTQVRPNVVWFGEDVPLMEQAISNVYTADMFIIVGTSLKVYPACTLLDYQDCLTYYIDPKPNMLKEYANMKVIKNTAIEGLKEILKFVNE